MCMQEHTRTQLAADFKAVQEFLQLQNCSKFQVNYYLNGRVSVSTKYLGKIYGESARCVDDAITGLKQRISADHN